MKKLIILTLLILHSVTFSQLLDLQLGDNMETVARKLNVNSYVSMDYLSGSYYYGYNQYGNIFGKVFCQFNEYGELYRIDFIGFEVRRGDQGPFLNKLLERSRNFKVLRSIDHNYVLRESTYQVESDLYLNISSPINLNSHFFESFSYTIEDAEKEYEISFYGGPWTGGTHVTIRPKDWRF